MHSFLLADLLCVGGGGYFLPFHSPTRRQAVIGSSVVLPFGLTVGSIVPEKSKVMRSNAMPLMLTFEVGLLRLQGDGGWQ